MKKLINAILLLIIFTISSCVSTARVSYIELPNKYKDIKIKRHIIVRDSNVYVTTIQGTPQKINTNKFNFEIIK